MFVLSDNAATVNVPNEYLYDLPSRQDVHGARRPRTSTWTSCPLDVYLRDRHVLKLVFV